MKGSSGGGSVPATLGSGHSLTLVVHTRTLEGQDAIAWTPSGRKALVAWTYQLEMS